MKSYAHCRQLGWKITCALLAVLSIAVVCLAAGARQETDLMRRTLQHAEGNFEAAWEELHTVYLSLLGNQTDGKLVKDVRTRLRERAIAFHEQFIARNADYSPMRWETARACRQVAELYGEAGQLDQAEAAHHRTIEFLVMARNDNPSDPAIGPQIADAFWQLGGFLADFDRGAEAAESYERAMDMLHELFSDGNDWPEYRYAYVRTFERWSDLIIDFEWPSSVDERYRELIQLLQQGVDGEPTSVISRHTLAKAYLSYAQLHFRLKRFTDAKSALQLAMDAIGERSADSPTNETLLRAEACLFGFQVCLLGKLGCLRETEVACQRFEEKMHELRSQTTGPVAFAHTLCELSGIFRSAGDLNRAKCLTRESLAVVDGASSFFESPDEYCYIHARMTKRLAAILRELGELDAAKRVLTEGIEFLQRTGSDSNQNHRRLLADHWSELGMTYYRSAAFSLAVDSIQQSTQIRNGQDASDWLILAMAKWRLHDTEEARICYAKAARFIQNMQLTPNALTRLHHEAGQLLQMKSAPPALRVEGAARLDPDEAREHA